jgi:diamine N-acetyltransferase
MKILGRRTELRPAVDSDREKVYEWLARSDLTWSMMGPPGYPDHPVPSWEEFCRDYTPSFFDASGDGRGRVFIILVEGAEVGTVGYDLLDSEKSRVVLDIWMKEEKQCGRGYGSDALDTLCRYLHETHGIENFVISPSARNKRAIAAYEKAGFEIRGPMSREEQEREFGVSEFDDNLLMMRAMTS